MNILILGMDGYIGWSLALHLAKRGHAVTGIDNFSRRKNVEEVGSWSATPIESMQTRLHLANSALDNKIQFYEGDLLDYNFVSHALKSKPETIIHLGEMPSAPYSMIDVAHAVYTQENNVLGNLNLLFAMRDHAPEAHLIKLGTMGEYGTPDINIPEGFLELEHDGRKSKLPFPRQPGSFYHASKVHDSHNIMLACKIWNLRSTDVMQGVVYGTRTDEINPSFDQRLSTRFDFDESFGTAINRYCAEAVIGHPLTVYGKGGQKRGFIALVDSIQCLRIACENPPDRGEYRVFNQLDEVYHLADLAKKVQETALRRHLEVEIKYLQNPRKEAEEHNYKVESEHLRKLGFRPTRSIDKELDFMLEDLTKFRSRVKEKERVLDPYITWEKGRQISEASVTNTSQL